MRKQLQACFIARSLSRKDSISIVFLHFFHLDLEKLMIGHFKIYIRLARASFLNTQSPHDFPHNFPTIFPTLQLQCFVGFLRVFTSVHGLEL